MKKPKRDKLGRFAAKSRPKSIGGYEAIDHEELRKVRAMVWQQVAPKPSMWQRFCAWLMGR